MLHLSPSESAVSGALHRLGRQEFRDPLCQFEENALASMLRARNASGSNAMASENDAIKPQKVLAIGKGGGRMICLPLGKVSANLLTKPNHMKALSKRAKLIIGLFAAVLFVHTVVAITCQAPQPGDPNKTVTWQCGTNQLCGSPIQVSICASATETWCSDNNGYANISYWTGTCVAIGG